MSLFDVTWDTLLAIFVQINKFFFIEFIIYREDPTYH